MGTNASPSGLQMYGEGGNPRILTGVAAADLEAGELVTSLASTTAQKVGSVLSTVVPQDIEVTPVKDVNHCIGICTKTVASGTAAYVPVAQRGTYILRAGGVISGGQGIVPGSATIQHVAGEAPSVSWSGTKIGTALTNSASGTNLYILATLNI